MLNIQFDFDPVTSEVTNLKVVKTEDEIKDAIVKLDNGRLHLSREALIMLNAKAGDRITINYYTVNAEETFPVIGRSELLSGNGNRLTGSNTVSYRGQQQEILLQYGKVFKLESFKSYCKMVPIEPLEEIDDLAEEELDLENLNERSFS